MELYLSKQADEKYMLTTLKPVVKRVGLGPHKDVYMKPGDPMGMRHICQWFVTSVFPNLKLEPLQSIKIRMGKWEVVSQPIDIDG